MPKTSLLEVQKAVFDRLTTDGTFMTKITGVFDDVPEIRTYPYVFFATAVETRFNTFGRDGKENTFTLDAVSHYHGFKEAYEIADRIIFLLDGFNLTVAGFTNTVLIQLEESTAIMEPENHLHIVSIRFRTIIQE